jgi:hypothetical protein
MTQNDVHRREHGIASSALFTPEFSRDTGPTEARLRVGTRSVR